MNKINVKNPAIPTEDFWSRQANAQTEAFESAPFGIPATITANRPDVLAAARLSSARFSRATNITPAPPITLQIVVQSKSTPALPAHLPEQLAYAGVGQWITLSAGEWGQGFANLDTGEGVILLSPALAAATRLVSRYFIDHYLLNFILTRWAMLHASCVLSPNGRLTVMIAPHNTGKSTTALHLLRAGYTFLADGMVLLNENEGRFIVGGYPIGEVKLRDDVLAMFPEYTGPAVRVREHQKTVVDLRAAHPKQVVETVITPESIQLCFMQRTGSAQTQTATPSPAKAISLPAGHTVYRATRAQFAHNTAAPHTSVPAPTLY